MVSKNNVANEMCVGQDTAGREIVLMTVVSSAARTH